MYTCVYICIDIYVTVVIIKRKVRSVIWGILLTILYYLKFTCGNLIFEINEYKKSYFNTLGKGVFLEMTDRVTIGKLRLN